MIRFMAHGKILPLAVLFFLTPLLPLAQTLEELRTEGITVSFPKTELTLNTITSFTAAEAQIFTALFEGLVSYHPFSLEPVPGVAERWEVSPDGRKYTFYLRKNARYWNGDQVIASHFRDTWFTLIDPDQDAPYSFLFDIILNAKDYRLGKLTDPLEVGIEAPDEQILRVTLENPASHFLKILCHHSFSPVHPDLLKATRWDSSKTVPGNGPFYIFERDSAKMKLLRNELYWDRKRVYPEELTILFVEGDSGYMDDFNEGQIQWSTTLDSFDQIADKSTIVVNPMFSTSYYFFRQSTGPLKDDRVRRALSLLLPWEEIRSPEITPATTLIPRIFNYPEVEGITRASQEEALELLSDAGYPEGRGIHPITIAIPGGENSVRISSLIKSVWEKTLEIEVNIREIPYPGYYEGIKVPDIHLATITWIGDYADPLTFLQLFLSDSNLNDAIYHNYEYDQLIERSMTETGDHRYKTLAEAETLLLENAVVLPIGHQTAINLVNHVEIKGWYPNPLDIHPFKYLRRSTPELPPGVVMR